MLGGGGLLQSGSVLPSGRKQTVPSGLVIVCPGGLAALVDEGVVDVGGGETVVCGGGALVLSIVVWFACDVILSRVVPTWSNSASKRDFR